MMPICSGRMPASANALDPAIAAASAKLTSSGHQRRSSTPASFCSRPGRVCTRRYVSASHSSIAAEVITIGASTAQTESTVVLTARKHALPLTSSPLVQGCCPRLRNLPVVHHRVTTTYVGASLLRSAGLSRARRTKLGITPLVKRLGEDLPAPRCRRHEQRTPPVFVAQLVVLSNIASST